jgi:hypothetical protein
MSATWAWPGYGYPQGPLSEANAQYKDRVASGAEEVRWDFDRIRANYGVLAGSPRTVRLLLEELNAQFPTERLLLWASYGGPPVDAQERCLRLFAEKVMPHFK